MHARALVPRHTEIPAECLKDRCLSGDTPLSSALGFFSIAHRPFPPSVGPIGEIEIVRVWDI